MQRKLSGWVLAAGLGTCLAGGVANAQSTPIGPGVGITNDTTDSGGGRINIDFSNAPTLQPGTYQATLFRFDAGVAGDVTPFLATGGGNNYTVIAVGTDRNAAVGQDQSLAFGGSDTFTLNAPTQVFGGIASDTQNPISLDNDTGTAMTDHEGGGQAAGTYVVTVGGTVPTAADLAGATPGISNPDLPRRYAFAIDVAVVPEPSVLGLAALGLGVLGCRLRRR